MLLLAVTLVSAQNVSLVYDGQNRTLSDTIKVMVTRSFVPIHVGVTNSSRATVDNVYARCVPTDEQEGDAIIVTGVCAGQCKPGSVSPEFSIPANDDYDGLSVECDVKYDSLDDGASRCFLLSIGTNEDTYDNLAATYMQLIVSKDNTGIDAVQERPTAVYPNPAAGRMTVECELQNGEQAVAKLHNMAGHEVQQVWLDAAGRGNFDVTSLPRGVYVCTVHTTQACLSTMKVVVR